MIRMPTMSQTAFTVSFTVSAGQHAVRGAASIMAISLTRISRQPARCGIGESRGLVGARGNRRHDDQCRPPALRCGLDDFHRPLIAMMISVERSGLWFLCRRHFSALETYKRNRRLVLCH